MSDIIKSPAAAKAQEAAQKEEKVLDRSSGMKWKPLPEMGKEAALRALVDELGAMGALTQTELTKLADEVSAAEAVAAMKRLRELEKEKITPGQMARSALAGGAAGITGQIVRETASGTPFKAIKGVIQENPRLAGKVLGLGKAGLKGLHGMGATALGSAALVTAAPFYRRHLHREAEKAKLKEFVGGGGDQTQLQQTRGRVKRFLGV